MAEQHDTEVWKSVVGYEGLYDVSSCGVVRACHPRYQTIPYGTSKSVHRTKKGYHKVALYKNGTKKTLSLHRIVLTAFKGPRPEGKECRHLDGCKDNNRLDNLAWGTNAENTQDKIKHGTANTGEACGWSKLTEDNVKLIRVLHASGQSKKSLGRMFSVTPTAIFNICTGRSWKNVK